MRYYESFDSININKSLLGEQIFAFNKYDGQNFVAKFNVWLSYDLVAAFNVVSFKTFSVLFPDDVLLYALTVIFGVSLSILTTTLQSLWLPCSSWIVIFPTPVEVLNVFVYVVLVQPEPSPSSQPTVIFLSPLFIHGFVAVSSLSSSFIIHVGGFVSFKSLDIVFVFVFPYIFVATITILILPLWTKIVNLP